MTMHWLERTELLLGAEQVNKLKNKHVLVVGLGGVGAYAAEQICRAGIGQMTIVDGDTIHLTNINRQLPALKSSIGLPKAEYLGKRLMDINPDLKLSIIQEYLRDDRMKDVLSHHFDYVVDAIDTLSPKIFLIHDAFKNGLRVVSSMGSGGKLDPTKVQIADISESHNCPLARILRKRLHRLGIRTGIKVVYSPEEVPENATRPCEGEPNKKTTVGTISYMPPIFGCFIASVVVRDLLADS
ncbi:MAG: tRNA threonylcarbamoyladenosine dehydratase [Bacteroidales bacterium]|nr:MAG: tRNA threonylcarbamoyladenosine dehydratase [Bacteroidales bacterium]